MYGSYREWSIGLMTWPNPYEMRYLYVAPQSPSDGILLATHEFAPFFYLGY